MHPLVHIAQCRGRALRKLGVLIGVTLVGAASAMALLFGASGRQYARRQFAKVAPVEPVVALLFACLTTVLALPLGAARRSYAEQLLSAALRHRHPT